MTGRIAGTPRPSERRYAGSFAPGTAARAGRTSSASVSSSESTVSVRGSLACPGTFVSPSACCTFSGLEVSLLSSKPDS